MMIKMNLFKERIPDKWCAYKTGEYEIAQIFSVMGCIILILAVLQVFVFYLGMLLFVLISLSVSYIDFNELRRRKKIIEYDMKGI